MRFHLKLYTVYVMEKAMYIDLYYDNIQKDKLKGLMINLKDEVY